MRKEQGNISCGTLVVGKKDFWNRNIALCTLFYDTQTCQVCVCIQTGYRLHFSDIFFNVSSMLGMGFE